MPIITVTFASPVSDQQADELIQKLTDSYVEVTSAKAEAVHVLLENVPADRWGVGGESLAARRAK